MPVILLLLPILLLLVIPGILILVHLLKPGFRYSWLIMVTTSLLAWLIVLLERLRLSISITLDAWGTSVIVPGSFSLLVDETSWPYLLAIASLTLALLMTEVARRPASDTGRQIWSSRVASLVIAALGLLAVMTGDLFSLLLAWTALDMAELLIRLGSASRPVDSERVIIAFSGRAVSLLILVGLSATARSQSFQSMSTQASMWLLIAAGLRLGALPLNLPLVETRLPQRGADVQLSFVPAAAALVIVARTASIGVPDSALLILLILACMAALYGGLSWASAQDAAHAQPYWIVGMAALAILSALVKQPYASLAWGLALFLPGSLIALYSLPHRRLLPLLALGLAGILTLPFTPAWQGVRLYTSPGESWTFQGWWAPALLAQALLITGYIRHALQPTSSQAIAERWIWLVYPWGLALLPLAHFLILWFGIPGLRDGIQAFPSLVESWPGLASLALAAPLLAWLRGGRHLPEWLATALHKIFSFGWLYRILWVVYRGVGRVAYLIERIFESEGGILWTLLVLTLLLAMLIQFTAGG